MAYALAEMEKLGISPHVLCAAVQAGFRTSVFAHAHKPIDLDRSIHSLCEAQGMATSSSSDGMRHRERASGEAKELQNPPEQGDGGDEPALNHTNDKSRREGPDRP